MVGDFQVGLGLGQGSGSSQTRFQRRPLSSNRPQPVDAVADYADLPFRLLPTVPMPGRQRLGGVLRLPGAILRSWASSTLVP